MFVKDLKFEIEEIADIIVKHIEELMVEKTSIANDFQIMKEQFGKVKDLQKKLKLDSLDFIFVWQNTGWDELFNKDKYKKDISEIYNRVNFKLNNSKLVSTFFRGVEGNIPSFHFPCNFNVWFMTTKNFINSKLKPIVVVNFGVQDLLQFIKKKLTKDQEAQLKYYFINTNDYYSYDAHVDTVWR